MSILQNKQQQKLILLVLIKNLIDEKEFSTELKKRIYDEIIKKINNREEI